MFAGNKVSKKYLRLIICLFCVMCVCLLPACGKTVVEEKEEKPPIIDDWVIEPGMPLFDYLKVREFANNFEKDFPVSVSVCHTTVAGGEPYTSDSESTIRAVFDALDGITVGNEAGSAHTDDYLDYWFTMSDGRTIMFEFQQGKLIVGGGVYELTGFGALSAALAPFGNELIGKPGPYTAEGMPEGETLIDWLKGEQYSYLFNIEIRDLNDELVLWGDGGLAVSGGDWVSYILADNANYRLIYKSGVYYVVDDKKKLCVEVPKEEIDDFVIPGLITDWSDMKELGSGGEEKIYGIPVNVENYSVSGADVQFFLDNGQVFAFKPESQDVQIRFFTKYASNRIHDGSEEKDVISFDIPKDYATSIEQYELREKEAKQREKDILQQSVDFVSPFVYPGGVLDENFSEKDSLMYDYDAPFKDVVAWYKDLWPRLNTKNGEVFLDDKSIYSYSCEYEGYKVSVWLRDMSRGNVKKCDVSIDIREIER